MIINFLVVLVGVLISFGCSRSQIQDLTSDSDGSLQMEVKSGEKDCTTPWGEVIRSGEVRKAFLKQLTSSCEESCDSSSAELKCQDGTLEGGTDYIYDRCDKPKCDCQLNFLANKPTLKHGDWIELYRGASIECGSCQTLKEKRVCNDGELSGSAAATQTACRELPCKDCYPDKDLVVAHGSSHLFYKISTGKLCNSKNTCSANSLQRTCQNGVLSGDTLYAQSSCTDVPCNCQIDTVQYNHGSTVKYYTKKAAACDVAYTCASSEVTSTCNNGVIAGLPAAAYSSCQQASCSCDFVDAKGVKTVIPDGGSIDVFTTETVGCDLMCTKGAVSCSKGVLSGNTTYKYTSCSAQSCRCQAPWGSYFTATASTSFATATPRSFFKVNTSTCGVSKCETMTGIEQKYICLKNSGVTYWADLSGNPVTDFSVYKYSACIDPTCYCTVNNRSIAQGSAQTFYKTNTVPCGVSCEASGNSMTIRCNKDLTSDVLPIGTNPESFFQGASFSTCTMAACPDVPGVPTDGGVVGTGDGEAGDGGGSGGGTGDGLGPGFHFTGRSSGGGSGSPGAAFIYYLNVLTPHGEGCALPWGGNITHLGTVLAFTQAAATGGTKCSSYRVLRTCMSGVLSGATSATHLNCTESP